MRRFKYVVIFVIALVMLVGSPFLINSSKADGGANHQRANNNYGVSGGNVNDASRSFCCSGTLGSLVRDSSGTNYILSNNHVLARADQAAIGEDISQPGLIDNGCRIPPIVADFTVAVTLGSNVDAAIAQLRTGAMNTAGTIEDIGIPSNVVKNASVGLAVAKSGRTTGSTTGSVSSVNTSVSVQYQKGCNQGKKFTVSYTNQVVINSSTFSAGGDSGSLIVTNDACHQPVALLFAGSSTTTIGNPIGEVLSKVSGALGSSVSFVGATCGTASAAAVQTGALSTLEGQMPELPQEAIEHATNVMQGRLDDLMSRPSVIGVGVGASDTNPGEAVIVIYVDRTTGASPQLPRSIDGVRVKRVETDTFVAR
ncbi:MAG: hypothetical protein AUG51_06415 [Acidobacteria bacterium 13_1_20CM_3_53_8]|nr:MAG: hypothetical protein AUG51_06415 [Acidobacteria bacterium 13_1_20CM_3_53_8]